MSLAVPPVEHTDVGRCAGIRVKCLGSIVIGHPPPYPGYVEGQEAFTHADLDNNDFVHHLKVVDTKDDEEVIAYANGDIYSHGRPDLEKLLSPMEKSTGNVDQVDHLKAAAHDCFTTRN